VKEADLIYPGGACDGCAWRISSSYWGRRATRTRTLAVYFFVFFCCHFLFASGPDLALHHRGDPLHGLLVVYPSHFFSLSRHVQELGSSILREGNGWYVLCFYSLCFFLLHCFFCLSVSPLLRNGGVLMLYNSNVYIHRFASFPF